MDQDPSVDSKGLSLLGGLLFCISFVAGIIALVLFFAGDHPWHLVWALPGAVGAALFVSLASVSVAGRIAGLRPAGVRGRLGVYSIAGLGTAGIYVCWLPPDDNPAWPRYWKMFASIVAVEIVYCVATLVAAALLWHEPVLCGFLFLCAACSAVLTSTSLTPKQESLTVGNMLRQLKHDGAAAQRYEALGRISALVRGGKFPEEWDPHLVKRILEPRDGSVLQLHAWMNAYAHYAEAEDFDRAAEILEVAYELSRLFSPAVRVSVEIEFAYAEALRGDPILARATIEGLDRRHFREPAISLIYAALAIRERHKDKFETVLLELKALPTNPNLAREIAQLEKRAADDFSV
jgi:hypothetical protein